MAVYGLVFMAAWYYIDILFNHVDAGQIFAFIATYSLWIVFVVTVVLALSAWLPTGGAAGLAIFITLIFQIIDSLIGNVLDGVAVEITNVCIVLVPRKCRYVGSMDECWGNSHSYYGTYCYLVFIMSKRNAAKTTI